MQRIFIIYSKGNKKASRKIFTEETSQTEYFYSTQKSKYMNQFSDQRIIKKKRAGLSQ